jgi:hypothetical protein
VVVRGHLIGLALLAVLVIGCGSGDDTSPGGVAATSPTGNTSTAQTQPNQGLPAKKPNQILRACGEIDASERVVRVDIAEGHLPLACGEARSVVAKYEALIGSGPYDSAGCCNRGLRLGGHHWGCYVARYGGDRVHRGFTCILDQGGRYVIVAGRQL